MSAHVLPSSHESAALLPLVKHPWKKRVSTLSKICEDFSHVNERLTYCEAWKASGAIEAVFTPSPAPHLKRRRQEWLKVLYNGVNLLEMHEGQPELRGDPRATWTRWRPAAWPEWANAHPEEARTALIQWGLFGAQGGRDLAWLKTCWEEAGCTPSAPPPPRQMLATWCAIARATCLSAKPSYPHLQECMVWLKAWWRPALQAALLQPEGARVLITELCHGARGMNKLSPHIAPAYVPHQWTSWLKAFFRQGRKQGMTGPARHAALVTLLKEGSGYFALSLQKTLLRDAAALPLLTQSQEEHSSLPSLGTIQEEYLSSERVHDYTGPIQQTWFKHWCEHPHVRALWCLWWQHAPDLCIARGWKMQDDPCFSKSWTHNLSAERWMSSYDPIPTLWSSLRREWSPSFQNALPQVSRETQDTVGNIRKRLEDLTFWCKEVQPLPPTAWAATLWYDMTRETHNTLLSHPTTCHGHFKTWAAAVTALPWKNMTGLSPLVDGPTSSAKTQEEYGGPPPPLLEHTWGAFQVGALMRWAHRLCVTHAPPDVWKTWQHLMTHVAPALERGLGWCDPGQYAKALCSYTDPDYASFKEAVYPHNPPIRAGKVQYSAYAHLLAAIMPHLDTQHAPIWERMKIKVDLWNSLKEGVIPSDPLALSSLTELMRTIGTIPWVTVSPGDPDQIYTTSAPQEYGTCASALLLRRAYTPSQWTFWMESLPLEQQETLIQHVLSNARSHRVLEKHAALPLTSFALFLAATRPMLQEEIRPLFHALAAFHNLSEIEDYLNVCISRLPATWKRLFLEEITQRHGSHPASASYPLVQSLEQALRVDDARLFTEELSSQTSSPARRPRC